MFGYSTRQQAIWHNDTQGTLSVDLSAELPNKLNILVILFGSDRVEVIPQQNTIRVFLRAQAQKQLAKLHSGSIAAFSAQNINVLDQTFAEYFVQIFALGRQIHLYSRHKTLVLLLASVHYLKVK